jgi:adenine C2-methylase RlmN of 23S rRNA A2503 and tRNA A37
MNKNYALKTDNTKEIVDQFPSLLNAQDHVNILRRGMGDPFQNINQIEVKNKKKVVRNENSNFTCEIKRHEKELQNIFIRAKVVNANLI